MSVSSENDGSCGQTACDNSPCNRRTTDEDVAHVEGIGAHWIVGSVNTPAGDVPQVGTRLKVPDRLGTWKARWGVGRMRYGITAGLYAVGNPGDECPVLVTANYKMSFDRLRSQLTGIDAWVLVRSGVGCAAAVLFGSTGGDGGCCANSSECTR